METKIRLGKYLANIGLSSRRKVPELLKQGLVKVNGKVAQDLSLRIDPQKDSIDFRNKKINTPKLVYFMLNKPKGVVSTVADERNRPTAVSLINTQERIYPVGRLDQNSTGLLLLTNDGELANRLIHPRYHIPKTYLVTVNKRVSEGKLQKLRTGVALEDGITAPAKVKVIKEIPEGTTLELILFEGKKREIRRMCTALFLEVIELHRIKMGSLSLGNLKLGKYRELTKEEVALLKKVTDIGSGRLI